MNDQTDTIATLSPAARDVLAERQRQIEAEGWTPEHDDEHDTGDMVLAAMAYSAAAIAGKAERAVMDQFGDAESTPDNIFRFWPWSPEWWKPKDRRRDLVRAAALLIAEIERIDRAADKEATDGR